MQNHQSLMALQEGVQSVSKLNPHRGEERNLFDYPKTVYPNV